MRIVSLLPSSTEILFALGLGDDIVGVTFECDYPSAAREKRIVSTSTLPEGLTPADIDTVVKERIAAGEDLYKLDRGAFAQIDPTLVVTQDLCAVCAVDVGEVDDALAYLGCSADVVTLDPMSLSEVVDSVLMVAEATGTSVRARELIDQLQERLEKVAALVGGASRPKALVLEWTDPAFTAGHWVPDLVEAAGATCALGRAGEHSVGVEWSTVAEAEADVVIVSPCGYRLDGAAELGEELLGRDVLPPAAQVWAIDADHYMVRPGPRVVEGVEILSTIFHPDRTGLPDPLRARRLR